MPSEGGDVEERSSVSPSPALAKKARWADQEMDVDCNDKIKEEEKEIVFLCS
jgi:hypothetical protein